jgi:hypothetical protein
MVSYDLMLASSSQHIKSYKLLRARCQQPDDSRAPDKGDEFGRLMCSFTLGANAARNGPPLSGSGSSSVHDTLSSALWRLSEQGQSFLVVTIRMRPRDLVFRDELAEWWVRRRS